MASESGSAPYEGSPVPDWNVTVTLAEPTFHIARNLLARWGRLRRTGYFNVAVMKVQDTAAFLREFAAAAVDRDRGRRWRRGALEWRRPEALSLPRRGLTAPTPRAAWGSA
jgi:hypothetical protein